MRNLLEYPVTSQEVFTSLELIREEQAAKKYVGDITGLCLAIVHNYLKARPHLVLDALQEVDREMRGETTNEAPSQDTTA